MVKLRLHIGNEIRNARKSMGLSQIQLAERVGVSYQQIQKYEKGQSEITISRLYQIAGILGVDVSNLLPSKEMMVAESVSGYDKKRPGRASRLQEERLIEEDELALLNLFRTLENKKIRDGLLLLLKGVAEKSRKP